MQDLIAAEQDELEEIDITEAEERDLQLFMPAQKSARRTLADIIMEKIAQKQTDGGGPAMPLEDMQQEQIASAFPYPLTYLNHTTPTPTPPVFPHAFMTLGSLEPRLVEMYTQVGTYLSRYTSGKVPKAFKIIPSLRNWEEVLFVTEPEKWTAQAMFVVSHYITFTLHCFYFNREYLLAFAR
jgi:essential nuclear protein 1